MKTIAVNRKARFNYTILETYEAGLVLTGSEVKSIKIGAVNINDGFCLNKKGELYLVNVHISPYKLGGYSNHDPTRDRKLLLHKREIKKIIGKITEKSITLIPLKIYINDKNKIKVEIALAKGKKEYDKREDIKRREVNIQISRYKKEYNREFQKI